MRENAVSYNKTYMVKTNTRANTIYRKNVNTDQSKVAYVIRERLRFLRMLCSWMIGLFLLLSAAVRSTSGSTCTPEVVCQTPSVELANLSYPLRQLNVSSTCGSHNTSSVYCSAENIVACDVDDPLLCSADQHPADMMLDVADSNPDLTTYWQSENSIDEEGAQPTTQFIEVM